MTPVQSVGRSVEGERRGTASKRIRRLLVSCGRVPSAVRATPAPLLPVHVIRQGEGKNGHRSLLSPSSPTPRRKNHSGILAEGA
jgi:hypothetical protein